MLITTLIFVEKIGRFVVIEFVKISDEFDKDMSKKFGPIKNNLDESKIVLDL